MADDKLDSLARVNTMIEDIRAEKKCYKRKKWVKESFPSVPLLWLITDIQQLYNHALLVCVQIALTLSKGAVASAFASRLSDGPIQAYLMEVCTVLIGAGYSIPTMSLYARIPQLDSYLSSVVARGGGLGGIRRTAAVLFGSPEWPALSVANFYDPV
jgi:hypothetical protein